ncbi:GNAT family N-acetyltransferase [Sorangium sp. So ce1036]|uniref:GNAT family N-acetyltransferase n=1 Tax=Sorangium sp. So ce1036 TaxID=3133328 RepID=UPI003F0EB513
MSHGEPSRKGRTPTLPTERLRLVAPEGRHFEAFAAMHADLEMMKYIGDGRPLDRPSAWLHLAMLIGHWDLRGYGVWAVEEMGTGELIGRAGLLHPDGWPDAELNWMIKPSRAGRGLATEAARAVLRFAWTELGLSRLISLVRPGNAASIRVAEKLGGSLAETIEFMGGPMHVVRYEKKT